MQCVMHLVRVDDDFEECMITPPAACSVVPQAEGARSHPSAHSPAATEPDPAEHQLHGAPLGGLEPLTWAALFHDHPALLELLLPWVRQELGVIFTNRLFWVDSVEGLITYILGLFGLDKEVLVRVLEVNLQHRAAAFVQQLLDVAVQRCSQEAHRLLGLEDGPAAEGWEGSPAAALRPAAP